jgi:hypothetical protein
VEEPKEARRKVRLRRWQLACIAALTIGTLGGFALLMRRGHHADIAATTNRKPDSPKERDYSTPAGRLIGKWTDERKNHLIEDCDYYGPLDKATHLGDFIRYRIGKRDPKTNAATWEEFKFGYKVLSENTAEHRITVTLFFRDGESRNESYYIEPNGLSLDRRTVIS